MPDSSDVILAVALPDGSSGTLEGSNLPLTNRPTLWRKVLPRLVKKFHAFCDTYGFRYRIHKRPRPITILNQINLLHTSLSRFLKLHFNIILPSCLFPAGLPTNACMHTPVSHTCYMPRLSRVSYPISSIKTRCCGRILLTCYRIFGFFKTSVTMNCSLKKLQHGISGSGSIVWNDCTWLKFRGTK